MFNVNGNHMLLLNIITETPIWVWILFVFLVTTGINGLSDREINVNYLFIMPLFFLIWGGINVIYDLAFPYRGLAAMLVGLMAGYATGWWLWRGGPQLKSKDGTNLIILPGTPWLIVFVVITFIIKYILILFLNIEPDLSFSLSFNLLFGVLNGLISGVLWGHTLNLYFTYRKIKKCN